MKFILNENDIKNMCKKIISEVSENTDDEFINSIIDRVEDLYNKKGYNGIANIVEKMPSKSLKQKLAKALYDRGSQAAYQILTDISDYDYNQYTNNARKFFYGEKDREGNEIFKYPIGRQLISTITKMGWSVVAFDFSVKHGVCLLISPENTNNTIQDVFIALKSQANGYEIKFGNYKVGDMKIIAIKGPGLENSAFDNRYYNV